MADATSLITRLADELEHAARCDHLDATGDNEFELCRAQQCAGRRALLAEARAFAARSGEVDHA